MREIYMMFFSCRYNGSDKLGSMRVIVKIMI